ncbi:LysR family transcriptional regulator [Pseudomonas sp. S37]|uniref:LysR substrate-binding domain-containing protein n=1 Tax=Pseudomonas sp. S37 TaxID=2767449 RepID=UPI0019132D1B|nr:LysR substrate-binding domain-containing protein [Pseudomonas sp. S37]MBK4993288.1 LysR family transcriptional regulator [Pseudomonas sp. S37]
MKYHQLKAFVTIVEEGSIRAAARHLHLSPAALTKAIKELEHVLGVSLIVRTTRGVQLTAIGQQLNVRARLIVAEMQRAREDVEQARDGAVGSLAAAITPATALTILPEAFAAFRRRFPGARVNISEGFPGTALRKLHDGTLDFAVLAMGAETIADEFEHAPLYRSELVVVARHGHPLSHATSLAELVDADWLLNLAPDSSSQVLFDAFHRQGLPTPTRIVECLSYGVSHGLVQGSDLITAMPRQLLDFKWQRSVSVLPLADTIPPISMQIVTRRNSPPTPAASLLIDCLQDAARRRGLA